MRSIIPLFLAIVLGAVAVVGVKRYIEKEREKVTRGLEPIQVVAAAKRIKKGTVITRRMLTLKPIEKRFLPDEAILAADVRRLVGQVIRRNVDRGTELLWSFFEPSEAAQTRTLVGDERAVTIPVDMVRGVAGLIRPNSRIDLYGTFSLEDKKKKGGVVRKTVLLLSDVTVLAVDNMTASMLARTAGRERRRQGYSSLTLAVSPEEAALLIFAQSAGQLSCALRDSACVGAVQEPIEVDLSNFLDIARKANQKRFKKAPPATGVAEPLEP